MKIFFGFIFFVWCNYLINAQTIILHCGQLIDVEKSVVLGNTSIIVEDTRIQKIVDGYVTASHDDLVIDLKNKVVMPGWIDMHVHIEKESNEKSYEQQFRENDSYVALRAVTFCEKTLNAGFTTVRDLGGSGVNVALREAINDGYIIGPRIFTSEKSIATTGGHADPTNGVRDNLKSDPGPKEGVINGPEEAAKAVRQRYKNGANCIKITSTGGVLSMAEDGSGPQFSVEEIEAIVRAAKDYGFSVAAHAHGTEGIRRAIIGGVHSIEHGTYMTAEIMDLMKKNGTYLVPTISAGKFVAEKAAVPNFYPKMISKKAASIGPLLQENFANAYKKGVKIAFGTDAGVSHHGQNAKEFVFMVEAGMPAMEALKAATINAATLLRQDSNIGSISPGKFADIIALDSDPIQNISATLNVPFVMKNGQVIKNI